MRASVDRSADSAVVRIVENRMLFTLGPQRTAMRFEMADQIFKVHLRCLQYQLFAGNARFAKHLFIAWLSLFGKRQLLIGPVRQS
jgi:hypothetical protein